MNNATTQIDPVPGLAADAALQAQLATIDIALRNRFEMESEQTAVGVYDLQSDRFAMLRGDTIHYAASVPKIAILLTYFAQHPEAATEVDDATRHELGLMIKRSDNALAAKYSQLLTLAAVATTLQSSRYRLYDAQRDGGLWLGKHYSSDAARNPDPLAGLSHAATVRQLMRFYLMLERGQLASPQASQTMRAIFASPSLEHLDSKFVKGLDGRERTILRKSGTWQDWHADTALIRGEDRRYILVALTHHPNGAAYLEELARRIDDAMKPTGDRKP